MLFQTHIRNIVTQQPKLSSIWIKTGDAKAPLKRIWMNESSLRELHPEVSAESIIDTSAELTEDHLSWSSARSLRGRCRSGIPLRALVPASYLRLDAAGAGVLDSRIMAADATYRTRSLSSSN